jgi:hypothetical protein
VHETVELVCDKNQLERFPCPSHLRQPRRVITPSDSGGARAT